MKHPHCLEKIAELKEEVLKLQRAIDNIHLITQPKGEQINIVLVEACRKALQCKLDTATRLFIEQALFCAGIGKKGGPIHG